MTAQKSRTARIIIWLYAITISIMLGGASLALWRNWIDQKHSVETKLVHDASLVSALVDSSLLDALKLLEITKRDMQQIDFAQATDSQVHQLLHHSVEQYTLYNQDDVFGLLLYIDKTGKIRAQNADGQLDDINVADRLYFKEVVRNPSLRFAIGDMVIGRVSGTPVFHLAVPLYDHRNGFSGLLIQQIKTADLAELVEIAHDQVKGNLRTVLPDGQIVFIYPIENVAEATYKNPETVSLCSRVNQLSPSRGNVSMSDGANAEGLMIGYSKCTYFGLTTIASIALSTVLTEFLSHQKYLLAYVLFAGIVISILFFVFYRKSLKFDRVQTLSLHDELTGLHNRRGFDEMLPILMRQALRDRKPISVLFIDIDHFKQFNDELGHEAGDQVLRMLAQFLQNSLHRPHDYLCRWGGEEFVAILPESDEQGALHVADKILKGVRLLSMNQIDLEGKSITVSIGLSSMMLNTENSHVNLIEQADQAMLEAKRSGRNRLVIYRQPS